MSAVDVDAGGSISVMTLHMSKASNSIMYISWAWKRACSPQQVHGHQSGDQEERALLYVGITRARKEVTLSWSRQRTIYGGRCFRCPQDSFPKSYPAKIISDYNSTLDVCFFISAASAYGASPAPAGEAAIVRVMASRKRSGFATGHCCPCDRI
jgi:hypothetical protein